MRVVYLVQFQLFRIAASHTLSANIRASTRTFRDRMLDCVSLNVHEEDDSNTQFDTYGGVYLEVDFILCGSLRFCRAS